MVSLLFVLDFIVIAALALYITHKANINLFVPTIPSIFIWCYLAFAYIGILPLYFFWNAQRVAAGVNDQNQILLMWVISSGSLLIIALTFLFIRKVLKVDFLNSYKEMYDPHEKTSGKVKLFSVIIFLASVAVTALYISKIQTVPLLAQLHGASADALAKARSAATNELEGDLHWYRLFYSSIPLFLSFYAFAEFLRKRSVFNTLFFLLVFAFTSFTSLMTTQKAPIVWYVIGLVIVYLITMKKTVNIRVAMLIGVAAVAILTVLYRTIMGLGERPLSQVLEAIASRAFTGQIAPAYFYLKMFPDYHPFLFFQSFPNPKGIFPWDHYRLTVEVMNFIHPDQHDVVRSAPTVFWGEMYANFGFGGIVLSSIIVAFVLYLLQVIIFKLKFNSITIGFCTWMIITMKDLAITSFSNYLFNIAIVTIIILTMIMMALNDNLKTFLKKLQSTVTQYL
ncbi:O-antigen polymerase [Tuberibacillus calidus]|jgi:oligosaccharide repeat unit polymerase|uniref:O-antigen polymerase n=1 Tax=Tuberibacillus calidus TaxID=340097 RepID=UPI00041F835D|nr:O-antigen polymerase [Tuberibacillus calidus]